jgi:hypothetical protein
MTATCRVAAILAVDVVGYSRLVSFRWRRMRLGGRIGGFVGALVLLANGATASEVSVERGLRVSIVSGCHDCHTEGYRESDGNVKQEKSLKGSGLGWRGPWGTTYATNLRLTVEPLSEHGFVLFLSTLKTLPPMPWYRVRAMEENDVRSLYRYIKSLGEAGKQAPTAIGPDAEPMTPYVVLDPPKPPAGCKRDLDCGFGLVCGASSQCVPK